MTATLEKEPQESKAPIKVTPMMAQYLEIKEDHKDALLFYRMGDFYEMFFEDAVVAAGALDIALTKRGKHGDDDIQMCGVPHHSYEPYLQKLIRNGYKVAICEQMESPEEAKKRGYKAVVRREVVRVVTPGTLIEDSLLDARESNYLACVAEAGGQTALAWLDMSTGEFYTCPTSRELLAADLTRLSVKELLLPDKIYDHANWREMLREYRKIITPHVNSFFDSARSEKRLKSFYEVTSLESFGQYNRAEIAACGALLEYVEMTQKGNLPRLQRPQKLASNDFMAIDAATRRNLELTRTMQGERKGSLLSIIDKTITGAGARLLQSSLSAPLTNPQAIHRRLDMVQGFVEESRLREDLRAYLAEMPDLERALSRICIGKAGPRDLAIIRDGLAQAQVIAELLEYSGVELPEGVRSALKKLGKHDVLVSGLQKALKVEVGMLARDGGFIAPGHHPKLDELRDLRDNARQKLKELQEKYRTETGVNSLKVLHNNVLGYFVDVTPNNSSKMTGEQFIHRQTLANAVRYTTQELRQLESDILNAADQALKLELMLFDELVVGIVKYAETIAQEAGSIAQLDMVSALAELAVSRRYTRPLVDDSVAFDIKGGRHPVVEANIAGELGGEFIANDCRLEEQSRLWLLTGPNMAGKSTFLRQNALIALLAQIGSYVPAAEAHIGCVDRLFSRVGASDDLARGRSTFMVEMVETATILNQATEKSLVILDEIGRGTATYDGLSIAWAAVEYLHDKNRSRALFATHYHELVSLVSRLPRLDCYSMKVKEWQGDVVFLHEVGHGAADRSYGVHVAKLAGLPPAVIKRAQEVLTALQQSEGEKLKLSDDLPLFTQESTAPVAVEMAPENSALLERVQTLKLDELSPKEALDILYELKALA